MQAVSIAAAALNSTGKVNLMDILAKTLLAMMPNSEAERAAFQQSLEKPCADFESQCANLGWLSNEDGSTCDHLSRVVADLSNKFTEIRCGSHGKLLIPIELVWYDLFRRRDVLSRARELLMSDYHNTMLGTGDAQEDEQSSAGELYRWLHILFFVTWLNTRPQETWATRKQYLRIQDLLICRP